MLWNAQSFLLSAEASGAFREHRESYPMAAADRRNQVSFFQNILFCREVAVTHPGFLLLRRLTLTESCVVTVMPTLTRLIPTAVHGAAWRHPRAQTHRSETSASAMEASLTAEGGAGESAGRPHSHDPPERSTGQRRNIRYLSDLTRSPTGGLQWGGGGGGGGGWAGGGDGSWFQPVAILLDHLRCAPCWYQTEVPLLFRGGRRSLLVEGHSRPRCLRARPLGALASREKEGVIYLLSVDVPHIIDSSSHVCIPVHPEKCKLWCLFVVFIVIFYNL